MIEIYFFTNLFDKNCYKNETLLEGLHNNLPIKNKLYFIPLININIIENTFNTLSKKINLDRNKFITTINQLALDFKSASFQGQKTGRTFLTNAQYNLIFRHDSYKKQLSFQENNGIIDKKLFESERNNKIYVEELINDQNLAKEMHVSLPNQTVIVDTNNYEAILMKKFNYQNICNVCLHKNMCTINSKIIHIKD